jgi:outer membrane protein assembly factor BamB
MDETPPKVQSLKLNMKRWLVLCLFGIIILSLVVPNLTTLANDESNTQAVENTYWLPLIFRINIGPAVPSPGVSEWTQDAHNAQRTGFTIEEPFSNWTLLWTWNGPDANGGPGGHFYDAPREARTVTGGRFIYVPAGSEGLYALEKRTGNQAWNIRPTHFNSTPAYDLATGFLYAGGNDGRLYKINSDNGQVAQTYDAGSPLNKSVLLADGYAYVVTSSGQLHKVNTGNMSGVWTYSANSAVSTPPAYSASRGVIVYATADLYIHAVREGDGAQHWRVKPTTRNPSLDFTFDGYWPVVAEQHGIVFVRLNLGMAGLWSGPGPGNMYPNSNSETRAFLQANPQWKNLFALSLDTGIESFIPAVGPGGVEGLRNNQPVLVAGPVPVVKVLPDGKEVAYIPFRSGQGNPPDGRWDSHLGEMVLDSSTVPGLSAGDLRFVRFSNSQIKITDEQTPLTMAGDTIFNAHWGASESSRITDRSNSRGLTFGAPINSQSNPVVIRRQQSCHHFNPSTHWTTCGLTLFDDGRYWNGPGWWVYWNVLDPPTPSRRAYSEGILPRYTYVSDGLVIVQGNGGDLFVLGYNTP